MPQCLIDLRSNVLDNDILIEIYHNKECIDSYTLTGSLKTTVFTINDEVSQSNIIEITMSGKNSSHTIIDDSGNIVSDVYVELEKILINDINICSLVCNGQLCYYHNSNGYGEWKNDNFYGFMGQNGTVTVKYSTPLYKWFISVVDNE